VNATAHTMPSRFTTVAHMSNPNPPLATICADFKASRNCAWVGSFGRDSAGRHQQRHSAWKRQTTTALTRKTLTLITKNPFDGKHYGNCACRWLRRRIGPSLIPLRAIVRNWRLSEDNREHIQLHSSVEVSRLSGVCPTDGATAGSAIFVLGL